MSIVKKINTIMKDVKVIKKDGKISFGSTKYNFIQDDEVVEVIREKMVEAGLVMYPTESSSQVLEFGGKFLTVTKQKFIMVDVEDETMIEIETVGQGADSADKGSGKSMTNARKYALLQTFMLTGDDPDIVASDSYRAPQQNNVLPPQTTTGSVGDMMVDFGKMKGKTLKQILETDRSYIEWLAGREGKFQQAAIKLLS